MKKAPANDLPPLVLSMGEPGGIGPETALMAWRTLRETGPSFALLGSSTLLRARAKRAGLADVPVRQVANMQEAARTFPHALPVLELAEAADVVDAPGRALAENAAAVLAAIRAAVRMVIADEAAALVTLPIQKESLYRAGFAFEGHTDYLAALAQEILGLEERPTPLMMLTAKGLRTVPVTVHVALQQVPTKLSADSIIRQGRILAHDLSRRFALPRPRIAVAGLNPHAGEGGRMGTEERTIIVPAIEVLRAEGINAFGPLPADTLFHDEARTTYDAVLCMYHDQALIPVKTLDFHGGVNVTLGLPFVRTSPDHGTALALAGSGTARPDSLIAALRLAARMALADRDHGKEKATP